MDIHHIHIYWTSVIYINYGHPHCGFQNIWFLSYMTDIYHIWRTLTLYDCHHHLLSNSNSDPYTLLSGPSLASKPLQEHKLIIMMELHHCWLSSTLLFIFQIKIYNCKIDTSHTKMELLEPSGKVWYRPLPSADNVFGEKLWANLGGTTEILIPFSNCIPVRVLLNGMFSDLIAVLPILSNVIVV